MSRIMACSPSRHGSGPTLTLAQLQTPSRAEFAAAGFLLLTCPLFTDLNQAFIHDCAACGLPGQGCRLTHQNVVPTVLPARDLVVRVIAWQVLSRALEALGLGLVPLDSPEAAGVAENPAREDAFMCNMQVREANAAG